MKLSKLYILLLAFLTSCEKEITLDIPAVEPKIVVEGHVENGRSPYVILTRSSSYFDDVDSSTIANTIVFDATVIVSDGITTDTMQPSFDFNLFPPFYYQAPNMKGVEGRTYTLKVIADGQTLTSVTTIPYPVKLDSVWFELQPPSDSLGFVYAHIAEPPGYGHAYRWFAKRLGKDADFIAPLGSSFDDKFIDGKSFDFGYNRGVKPNSSAPDDNNEERGYFKKGDTIVVKFCAIDHAAFEFFRSFETEIGNNGNPFAAPTTIKTNIEGGGLGIWSGYGAAFDTVIAR